MTRVGETAVRTASLVALVVCVVTLAMTVAWGRTLGTSAPAADETGFRHGDVVGASLRSDGDRGSTLLVFLRSDCTASRTMADWLPDLMQRLTRSGVETVAVVAEAGGATETAFAASAGFEPSRIRTVSFDDLPLRVVPAFVLLNGKGEVILQRAGAIDREARGTFVQTLVDADD